MEVSTIGKVTQALFDFSRDAEARDFAIIFGESVGFHLWEKFRNQYDYDLLGWWGALSTEMRIKFIDHIASEKVQA